MKHIIFVFIAFLGTFSGLFAQKDLPSETVDVIKDFEVRLLESTKLDLTPALPAVSSDVQPQNYTVVPRPVNVSYEPPKLRPVGIKREENAKSYPGYARLGGGIPTSLLGEASYNFGIKNTLSGKAWVNHHSANAASLENQRFMDNEVGVRATYSVNKTTAVEAYTKYNFDRVHYYGYNHDSLTFEKEALRQDFKRIGLGGRFFNTEGNEADLNFEVAPNFYHLADFYGNNEIGFDLNAAGTKWFADKHPLRLNFRTDFTRFNDTVGYNLNNFYIQPSFTLHFDAFKLKIGANFASHRDNFSIFPDVEALVRVWGDGVQVFAGATGDLRKNTFQSFTEYNPFINPRLGRLRNTHWTEYYGGVKGIAGWAEYTLRAGYGKANGLALYDTDFSRPFVRFTPVFDTVQVLNIQGNLKLNPMKNLTVVGTLSKSFFETQDQAKAWGLPGLEGNASLIYRLLDGKATARADIFVADQINFRDETDLPQTSKALLDLSLGGTYQIVENVGIFLDLNNLLNNRRERWYRYPTFGTNFLGGVTVRF